MTKEMIVSDESYNSYNIRVLTAGGDIARFLKNPIMLYNHIRVHEAKDADILPIGTWSDLKAVGSEWHATPVFDEDDTFALRVKQKYDKGVIRAASIGIVPMQVWDDGTDEMGNQRYTIARWELREISITDIPSNANAVYFYAQGGDALETKDVINFAVPRAKPASNQPSIKMSKYNNVPALLGLTAEASEEAVTAKLNELLALKAKNGELESEVQRLRSAEAQRQEQEIINLADKAVADKQLGADKRDNWIKLAKIDLAAAKSLLDGMAPPPPLSSIPSGTPAEEGKYEGMTFSELTKKAPEKLMKLKAEDPQRFAQLYKSEYKKEYRF